MTPRGNIKTILSRLRRVKILVLGDIVLDEFLWGTVKRISPEAPVPVVEVSRESRLLGGAANVVNNIASLGAHALLCGVIGDDRAGETVRELVKKAGGNGDGVIVDERRPTSMKTRVIAQHQQVVRFDKENRDGIPSNVEARMIEYLRDAVPQADAVIISDYGKGVVSRDLVKSILREAKKKRVIVSVDPKPENLDYYTGVTVITPNLQEAQAAVGFPLRDEKDIERGAAKILESLGCQAVVITRGEQGMSLFEKGRDPVHIPTVAREVYDVTGAGDTAIAALTACLAAGASLTRAAVIANHAAGIVVGKLGTATATPEEILESLHSPLR